MKYRICFAYLFKLREDLPNESESVHYSTHFREPRISLLFEYRPMQFRSESTRFPIKPLRDLQKTLFESTRLFRS